LSLDYSSAAAGMKSRTSVSVGEASTLDGMDDAATIPKRDKGKAQST